MKTKNIIIVLLVSAIYFTLMTSCYNAPKYDIAVYVTSAGQKYHKGNCRYVKGKAIEIKLSRALYKGYDPCKVCRPPKREDLEKINKGD